MAIDREFVAEIVVDAYNLFANVQGYIDRQLKVIADVRCWEDAAIGAARRQQRLRERVQQAVRSRRNRITRKRNKCRLLS